MKTQTVKAQTANGQIEQSEWKQYLTDFTSRNENRPARLEILGDDIDPDEEAEHLQFMMASFEDKGADAGDALLTLGGTNGDRSRIMHIVRNVTSIAPQIETDGSESALEIAGADERAIVAFE